MRLIASLLALALVVQPGLAAAQVPAPAGDPPARVGRVAVLTGTVSYHLANADRWEAATLNLPVTNGFALWTEPAARAELGITGDRLVLDQSTELDVTQLDDRVAATALPQGTLYWRARTLPAGDSAGVQTPRGQVSFMQAGRYEVLAGDTTRPTVVAVVEGEATVSGPGLDVRVGPNQAATITGDGVQAPFQASVGPLTRDAFLTAVLAQEQPPRPAAAEPPQEIYALTGGEVLAQEGEWATVPEYGAVWYPPTPGYVPYRAGHWAFVAPWGWTWVDDAPWGFAPSHYGRWLEFGGRWGWIPGPPAPRPVYAPALVGFLGGAAAGALLAGRVGWVPLGPREPYYPPYRVSQTYIRNVNVNQVNNITINRPGARPPFANTAAATVVPAAVMAGSRGIAGAAQPVPPGLPPSAVLAGRAPMAPTRETLGVTPAVARQLALPAGAAARPAAPGPVFRGRVAGPEAGGPGRPNSPLPAALGGAAAGAAAGALLRPGAGGPGLPPLRDPGQAAGFRANGGAPGPAIGPRPAIPAQLGPGQPQELRPESRPESHPELRPGQPGPAVGPRPEPRFEARPELRPAQPGSAQPGPAAGPRPSFQPQRESLPGGEARPAPRPGPPPAAQPQAPAPVRAPAFRPEVQRPQPMARPEPMRAPPQAQPQFRPPPPQAHQAPPPPQARPAPPPPQARPGPPPGPQPGRPGPHPPNPHER